MYSTPRKQRKNNYGFRSGGRSGGGGSGPRGTPTRQPGLFEDKQWFCDCTPRLPALRLQVKKEGPNKGRWFYTCQRERRDQCRFFLWEDDAKGREEAALLLGGGRSEPHRGISTSIGPGAPPTPTPAPRQQQQRPVAVPSTPSRGPPGQRTFQGVPGGEGELLSDDDDDSPMFVDDSNTAPSSRRVGDAPVARSAPEPQSTKRKRSLDDVGGEDFSDGLDSDMEREMAAIADESAQRAARQLTTEPKSLSNDMLGLTPVRPRSGAAAAARQTGLPTPATTTPKALGSEPVPTPETPTQSTGTVADAAPAADGDEDYSITEAILRLLPPSLAASPVREAVRAELNGYALRVRSVYRARDMAQAALSTRDARIAQLQERVGMLENSRRLDRERMREMRSGLRALAEVPADGLDAEGDV